MPMNIETAAPHTAPQPAHGTAAPTLRTVHSSTQSLHSHAARTTSSTAMSPSVRSHATATITSITRHHPAGCMLAASSTSTREGGRARRDEVPESRDGEAGWKEGEEWRVRERAERGGEGWR